MDYLNIYMFIFLAIMILSGYPVTFVLMGTALIFGLLGFGLDFFSLLPLRVWGSLTNATFIAVPLFVFMGLMLERSGLAEELLDVMFLIFRRVRGGIAVAVVVVGALLGASTGIVGATVITMGLIALPNMLKRNYSKTLATGTIAASGTLGQIIPPSIVLIILGDIVGVSVRDLFVGAFIPGMVLVGLYMVYVLGISFFFPKKAPAATKEELGDFTGGQIFMRAMKSLFPPFFLILMVLGSIFGGFATPTEAAAVGAVGSILLTVASRKFTYENLTSVMDSSMRLSCMVFFVLIGATAFSLVFRGLDGDAMVRDFLTMISETHGATYSLVVVMLVIFVMGFFLDFIEITFITMPILAPIIIAFGIDPLWFAVMVAVNLQTSFLTPPFGFSLFYLKSVSPPEVQTIDIYKGIAPFVAIQLVGLAIIAYFPWLVTWLPKAMG